MLAIRLERFVIMAFFLFCLSKYIYAAENATAASKALCEYGIELYERGNVNDAVQQLRLALMADPVNSAAKNYLDKIGYKGPESSKDAPSSLSGELLKPMKKISQPSYSAEEPLPEKEDRQQRLKMMDAQMQGLKGD